MTLSNELQSLRDRTLADLDAAHDYYAETMFAWRLVRKVVKVGNTFTIQNLVTGTVTAHDVLAAKSRGYVAKQLAEATFQQFISIFENFFFDLLRLWLTAYPQHLFGKKVDFRAIHEAPDKDAITQQVISKELNEVLYERPSGWFAYLEDKVKLGCPTLDEIDRIAEAKAARDVLAHNRGIASKTYVSKAGKLARYQDGEAIDVPGPYHRETWELLRKVVAELSNAALAKAP